MKNNKKKKFDSSKFEALKINGEILKGGFSSVLKSRNFIGGILKTNTCTNNCHGGNCAAGCGTI